MIPIIEGWKTGRTLHYIHQSIIQTAVQNHGRVERALNYINQTMVQTAAEVMTHDSNHGRLEES